MNPSVKLFSLNDITRPIVIDFLLHNENNAALTPILRVGAHRIEELYL
jgi:hypothetical protein